MTIGKCGKYDRECEMLLLTTNAAGVCVLVVRGNRGDGFSVAVRGTLPGRVMALVLRQAAEQIERDIDTIHRKEGS